MQVKEEPETDRQEKVQDRDNPVHVAFSIVSLVLPCSCCLSHCPFLSLSLFLCLRLLLLVGNG